jgi:hypothetical protein
MNNLKHNDAQLSGKLLWCIVIQEAKAGAVSVAPHKSQVPGHLRDNILFEGT